LTAGTEESEAPERYFWWSGLAAISAIIRKSVFIDRYYYKLYPNIYVALVSSRSGLKKGVPISIVKSILEDTDSTRVISGCTSIQALIQTLSMQETFSSGLVIGEAQGIMVSDEFESFLTEDSRALTYLTALHNTHEHERSWKKKLKGSPIEELKAPCLTLLVASNEVLFDSVVKSKDIEGGFIARTFIIHESRQRLINPLVTAPKTKLNLRELSIRLMQIGRIKGEFKWTQEAKDYYSEWYTKLCKMQIDDRTGSIGRLGDQVLKVTMLLSLARKESLDISLQDLKLAISRCEECLPSMRSITMNTSETEIGDAIAFMLKLLVSAPNQEMTRARILTRLHPKGVDSLILDRVIESLIQSKSIKNPYRNEKREITYKMRPEVYERYVKFFEEEE
jgi:hypothetical protein